jgi:hypothetical protein
MPPSPNFNARSAQAIAETVKRVLGTPQDATSQRRPFVPRTLSDNKIIEITATNAAGLYTGLIHGSPPKDVDKTVPLASSILGPTNAACTVMNLTEIGGGKSLNVGDYVDGVLVRINSDGSLVAAVTHGLSLPDGNAFTVLTKINSFQDTAFVLPLFT